jgi:hypothetical protein
MMTTGPFVLGNHSLGSVVGAAPRSSVIAPSYHVPTPANTVSLSPWREHAMWRHRDRAVGLALPVARNRRLSRAERSQATRKRRFNCS